MVIRRDGKEWDVDEWKDVRRLQSTLNTRTTQGDEQQASLHSGVEYEGGMDGARTRQCIQ